MTLFERAPIKSALFRWAGLVLVQACAREALGQAPNYKYSEWLAELKAVPRLPALPKFNHRVRPTAEGEFDILYQATGNAEDMNLPEGASARLGSSRFVLPEGNGGAVALSSDGRRIASGGSKIFLWNADTAKLERSITTPFHVNHLVWSRQGKKLAAMHVSGELRVLGVDSGHSWTSSRKPERLLPEEADGPAWPVILSSRFVDGDRKLAIVTSLGGPSVRHGDFLGTERIHETLGWRVELWDVSEESLIKVLTINDEKRTLLKGLGKGYEFRYVALSPSGEKMAWLASPRRDLKREKPASDEAGEKEQPSVVFLYETATSKFLRRIEVPRSYRVDLADEGETLVVHPVRPVNVDRIITRKGTVVNGLDGRVRFHYEHRFAPPQDYFSYASRLVFIAKSAVRFRDWLLTFDNVGVVRWDPATGKKVDEAYLNPFPGECGFALSADRRRIALGEGRRLQISDGALTPIHESIGFSERPSVRFLSDGRLLCWTANSVRRIQVWDPRKGSVLERHWLHPCPAEAITVHGSDSWGKVIAYLSQAEKDFQISLRDLSKNEPLLTLATEGRAKVYPSGDGKRLLYYSHHPHGLEVRCLDARNGKQIGEYRASIPLKVLMETYYDPKWFAEDGSVFGHLAQDQRLILVDGETGKVQVTLGLVPKAGAKTPTWNYRSAGFDRLLFARPSFHMQTTELAVWDRRGNLLRRLAHPVDPKLDHRCLCLSPDGRLFTLLDASHKVISLYETATARKRGEIRLPYPLAGAIFEESISFSPDGKVLATSGPDTNILLWDLARPLSGKKAMPPPKNKEETQRLWELLGDPDPTESDRALWTLTREPEHVYRLTRETLDAFKRPDPKLVREWIEQLGSKDIKVRESASQQLLKLNHSILPALREARTGATLEVELRLDGVIKQQEARQAHARLKEIRILEVLERIGTAEARGLVEAVADRPDSEANTHEARLILARWREGAGKPE